MSDAAITMNADNGVTINDDSQREHQARLSLMQTLIIMAQVISLAGDQTLNSSAGALDTVSITADDIILNGSINAGAGDVSLLPSNSTTVGLGAGAGDFSLTDMELDSITASWNFNDW